MMNIKEWATLSIFREGNSYVSTYWTPTYSYRRRFL